jgi:PAS domain S-box-containing protein
MSLPAGSCLPDLQEATAALAGALTGGELADVVLSMGQRLFAATAGVVYLADEAGGLTLQKGRGLPLSADWRAPSPATMPALAEAIARGEPLWFESWLAVAERYPALAASEGLPAGQIQAAMAMPLFLGPRLAGAFALGFGRPRGFAADERRWFARFAHPCALAAERVARHEAERRAARQAEETHRRLVDELSATVRLNETLAGVLAHDLRNPLSAIMTAAQLASRRNRVEELTKPLSRILHSGERMSRMVSQLLDFTRIRLGEGVPLEPRPSDLRVIARHAIDELELAHPGAVVQLEHRGDPGGTWDDDRLSQIFSNLIGNALQHGAGGAVTVRIDGTASQALRIEVQNAGTIPSELIPKLFEPLTGGERRGGRGGLGLGLFITQQIARAHGGDVLVESGEVTGTTFTVSLPRIASGAPGGTALPAQRPLREARERAWQSEQRMRLLIETIRDYAIFMLDPQGRVSSWNPGIERIHGFAADEVVGRHCSLFYPPDAEKARADEALTLALGENGLEEEGWRARKDGSLFWASVVTRPIRGTEGGLMGYAQVVRDLTERRRAQQRLQESEQRFRLLVESVRDYAIFMLDPEGRVQTWNLGAQLTKGYLPAEIIGEHISRFYPDEDRKNDKPGRLLAQAAEQGRVEDEGWRVRKDGSRFWADVVLTALRDPSGQLTGFAKVTRDLTDRRTLENQRVELAQAQEAIRLRDGFLHVVSHELKTPLAGLQLQIEALLKAMEVKDTKTAANLERAWRSGDRLAELIEALLDVSQLTNGRFALQRTPLDLAEVVGEVLEGLRPNAATAKCELVARLEGPVSGSWDRVRMEQVVTNLLSNAIKYGAGKPIEISLVTHGPEVVLEVRDQGPGISEEVMGQIFQRFGRGAPIANYGGLGLGLYLVREIARAHGGTASLENAPGGGALATVRLPLALTDLVGAEGTRRELQ